MGAEHSDAEVLFHGWFTDPSVWSLATSIAEAGHASWVENFPAVRVEGVEPPSAAKPLVSQDLLRTANPQRVRELLGDGSGGGAYVLEQEKADSVWAKAVAVLEDRLHRGWGATG